MRNAKNFFFGALTGLLLTAVFLVGSHVISYEGNVVTPTGGSSSSGAPTNASYLTMSLDGTLSGERMVTGTANQVIITDNGANSTTVFSLPQSIANSSMVQFGGITSTGQSYFTSGTLTAPGITFTNDTNTGIFQNAVDQIAFTAGGGTDLVIAGSFIDTGNGTIRFSSNGTCNTTQIEFCRTTGFFIRNTLTTGIIEDRIQGVAQMRISESAHSVITGTSSLYAVSGGTIFVTTTAVGNVGTGEDNLITWPMPSSTMSLQNDYITIEATGTFAASANNKRLKAYFGNALLFDSGTLAVTAASEWDLDCRVTRITATTQKGKCKFVSDDDTIAADPDLSSPTSTLSSAQLIRLTGEATADNDVRQEDMLIKWSRGQ